MKAMIGTEQRPAPRRFGPDWILGGVGVSCALASASFAAYMIVVGPGAHGPGGNPDFGIFARYDTRPREGVAPSTGDAPVAASPGEKTRRPDGDPPIDFAPTGSITDERSSLYGQDQVPTAPDQSKWLRGYTVRDVFDGMALVEARSALQLVEPGTMLQGVGQVTAIERQSGTWVVVTTGGRIGSPMARQASPG